MVAALYVGSSTYPAQPRVDCWDVARDARLYPGPYPVVAHPPCERWGRYAPRWGRVGEDDGCFEAALAAVETYGGVIEHPAGSLAWSAFGIPAPPGRGGWIPVERAACAPAWTCRVEQGHYGHRARKATWLYAVCEKPPELIWGPSEATIKPRPGRDYERERRTGAVQRMCRAERERTPPAFAEVLVGIARGVRE